MIPIRYAPLYFVTVLVLFFGLNILGNSSGLLDKELSTPIIFLMAICLTAIKFILVPIVVKLLGGSSNNPNKDE